MSRTASIVITVFWAVLCAGISTVFAKGPYLKSCGEYKITGKLQCKGKECSLIVWPGSQAETSIQLKSVPGAYFLYRDSTIKIGAKVQHISVTENQAIPLDKVPLRSLPDSSSTALRLIKKSKCD